MRLLEINAVPYGSTGKIAKEIQKCAEEKGHEAFFAYSWTKGKKRNVGKNEILIGSFWSRFFHLIISKYTGLDGFLSNNATRSLIKTIEKIKPDIVHLHILHSFFINIELLFDYLNKVGIKVVWTFHDCWAFTGGCPYFLLSKCQNWKEECENCPLGNEMAKLSPGSIAKNFKRKQAIVDKCEFYVITPSQWMAQMAKLSICRNHLIKVINNGIDLSVFYPIKSDFKQKYKVNGKKIILAVAFDWGKRKGLDIVIELEKRLSDQYQFVIVGTDDKLNKTIPDSIITIQRTNNQTELAEIYAAADVFINTTREDNFPTVNIEALACGTPVVTFDVGGSCEMIDDTCGIGVPSENIDEFEVAIRRVLSSPALYSEDLCRKKAKDYDCKAKFNDYVEFFEKIIF